MVDIRRMFFGGNTSSGFYSLHDNIIGEVYCAKKIKKLLRADSDLFTHNIEEVVEELERENKIKYAEKQKDAIRAIGNNNLLVVTGGPGTGKTTIIKAIIEVYNANFKHSTIKLVAPTGRAAKKMKEATGYEAKTIHRELGYREIDGKFGSVKKFVFHPSS